MASLHGVHICWDGCVGEGTGGSSCLTTSIRPVLLKKCLTQKNLNPVSLHLRPSGYVIELVEYLEIMAWGVNASNLGY